VVAFKRSIGDKFSTETRPQPMYAEARKEGDLGAKDHRSGGGVHAPSSLTERALAEGRSRTRLRGTAATSPWTGGAGVVTDVFYDGEQELPANQERPTPPRRCPCHRPRLQRRARGFAESPRKRLTTACATGPAMRRIGDVEEEIGPPSIPGQAVRQSPIHISIGHRTAVAVAPALPAAARMTSSSLPTAGMPSYLAKGGDLRRQMIAEICALRPPAAPRPKEGRCHLTDELRARREGHSACGHHAITQAVRYAYAARCRRRHTRE